MRLTRSSQSWQVAVVREWVRQGACASQACTLLTHQAFWGGYPAVLTRWHYTQHLRYPHLICTLQLVVDEVFLPMWRPG